MEQLTQQLKSGKMEVVEVPLPQLQPGYVLVRNHYSVISPGTEGKTVTDARKGYIAKARSRQKEVQQVIKLIKTQGLKDTYNMVMNKLDALSPLGYSTSGEVVAVGEGVTGFNIGDLVACGGGSMAVHADVVSVPQNLCVKVGSEEKLQEASFTTIASIALQGIRQSETVIGGKVAVVGLGLIGIITQKLLKTSGISSIGIDISAEAVETSGNLGFKAIQRSSAEIVNHILDWTDQHGVDAVIITAGTSSLDPVNFAGEITRRKGKVVIVGAVPTGFDRKNYYQKELDLKMSCSYGPGRYDTNYEDKGIDYPIGYVRWTEQRNMQTVCDLLESGSLKLDDIITHRFKLEQSPEAYDLILGKTEPHLGIIIEYDTGKDIAFRPKIQSETRAKTNINTGLIGAGSFAQNILLPSISSEFTICDITSGKGNNALSVSRKYSIPKLSQDSDELVANGSLSSVFILTRHNLHAKLVCEALKNGKNVYVEKPLAITHNELDDVRDVYENNENTSMVMVGFNRRFSPLTQKIKSAIIPDQPVSINIRVNAGALPDNHWVNDLKVGGGRLIGEGCHFVDLAYFLGGSEVETVNAIAKNTTSKVNDTFSIQLSFKNGSIANIAYFSDGAKSMSKELVEVFTGENVYVIDDFKKLVHFNKNNSKTTKLKKQDKGHKKEIQLWAEAQKTGVSPIPFDELVHTHKVCFAAEQAIKEKRTVWMNG